VAGKQNETCTEMLEHIGDLNQLMSCQNYILSGGMQEGVRAIEIKNGGNLSATILPGRCMDIYQVHYKGKNTNYIAPCGIVAPEYYESQGTKWLRNFFVGLLTTCGLQHFGSPKVIDGEDHGLHGRISNTPAENIRIDRLIKNSKPAIKIEGTMREARLFGENLTLKRQMEFSYNKDKIVLKDTITNHGYDNRQFLYALHLNFGYPLLDAETRLIIESEQVTSRDDHAAKYVATWQKIEAPSYPYQERCYFHKLARDLQGMSGYTLFNDKLGLGVKVSYKHDDLPFFCEWKMLGKGEYVLGLEPMNVFLDGPKLNEEGCMAPILAPGADMVYEVEIEFIDKI
jgi:hypothetical protein